MNELTLMNVPEPADREFVMLVQTELTAARMRALDTLRQPVNSRNRLGKGKLSEKDVQDAYALYRAGDSLRTLGETLYEKHGYKSAAACYNSLRGAFRVRGLKMRSQGDAMVAYHKRRRLSETTKRAIARHF